MKRQILLAAVGMLIVALASFSLFNAIGSQTAGPNPLAVTPASSFTPPPIYPPTPDPNPRPTAVPMPFATPVGTPLPTPDLGPSPTPWPAVPSPVWTPIPPVVNGWVTFTSKSGFSFSYPQGWYVLESVGVNQPSNTPAVDIHIDNVSAASLPPKTYIIPGGMGIELMGDTGDVVPTGGSPFLVGVQGFPGQQHIYSRDDVRLEPQFRGFMERRISVYFPAGKWHWVVSCGIFPPAQSVEQYTEIFHQVVRSLYYDAK